MKKGKILKKILWSVLAGLSVYFVCLLCVPLLGPAWHMVHGNPLAWNEWKILVPRGYWVTNESRGPALWRLSIGSPLLQVPYARLSFNDDQRLTHSFEPNHDYKIFEESMAQSAAQEGFRMTARNVFPTGRKSAYCVEFNRDSRQPKTLVDCAVEGTKTLISFEGDRVYLTDFVQILRDMSFLPARQPVNAGGPNLPDCLGASNPCKRRALSHPEIG